MQEKHQPNQPGTDARIDERDDFIEQRVNPSFKTMGQNDPYSTFQPVSYPKKSKLLAGLFAFIIPGTGHFYLGLMEKGLMMMLLIILDIVGIIYFSVGTFNIPLIVLLALMLPVIYFYNIFDALQSTDHINARLSGFPDTSFEPFEKRTNFSFGWVLIAAGILIFLISGKPAWVIPILSNFGAYIGAAILIAVGLFLFIRESKK